MGKGYFLVSEELIKDLLYLPEDTELIDINRSTFRPGAFTITISNSQIPELDDIDITELNPSVTVLDKFTQDPQLKLNHFDKRDIVWEWNIEESDES